MSSDYVDSVQSVDKNRRRYTVQRTDSSVSDVTKGKVRKGHCYAVFLCVVKWLAAIFLFAVVLFCVVTSKICLLVLAQQFRSIDQTGKSATEKAATETKKQALFIMLLLALMIPQASSVIYASWTSLRRKSRPWPTKQGFIVILIGGFLETISLCYITMVMLTVVPINPDAIVLLMCSLHVAPAIWQAIKSKPRLSTATGKLDVTKFVLAAISALLGIALLCYKIPGIATQISIVVAFILLSIAWSPKMRQLQIESKTLRDENMTRRTVLGENFTSSEREQGPTVKRRTARRKAAIVSSLVKLILTPLFATVFAKIFNITELSNISAGFKAITVVNPSFVYFVFHVFASLFGYHFGWLACSLCMQQIGYALPLTLATPIAVFMTHVTGVCETNTIPLPCRSEDQAYTLIVGVFLWLAQFLATTYYVWKSQGLILAKAHHLLWIPSYNGICLEQYLLLNRRNEASDDEHVKQQKLSREVNVFICTTMYHEEDYEMEQLLRSIHDVDTHSKKSGRHYESHIFFDGCVRAEVLNNYVLQLASLVENTLEVDLSGCTKMKTPYGMQLKWRLPGGMEFIIHLKDNAKVKNKKRWSQVMYMSYVLDYKEALLGVQDGQSFILTTDADVKFTHESVEALIDQIIEDPQIGAVCARTHPMGSGPIVWYQIFDYAIGHWFQKVANHMLGSVLCSPGCFSLYRCQAVRDVLPTYATRVDHAFEFLTKDMGEDRWMCTLMIQKGWRLTYCAAAVDSTYCPESFDEFYKQRRRWTPSTLANLVLLVREWKMILKKNEHISFLFIIYQTFLVCSTVIGPSTVILVIVGGMLYSGVNLNEITIVVLICLIVVAYAVVCLFASQNFQLKVSKLLTFVFAVIMCIVVIGVAVQISNELKERNAEPTAVPTLQPNTTATTAQKPLEHHLPAGISTLYLAGLSGIFVAAALLHPKEFTCLLHGVWYLLCLPSGYLLLTIYSLCNLTDRSWGTREGKSTSEGEDLYKPIGDCLKDLCSCFNCCGNREVSGQSQKAANHQARRGSIVENRMSSMKAEFTHPDCKITESSDQSRNKENIPLTAKGEVVIKLDDKDVLSSPADKILPGNKKEKRSDRICRKNSVTWLPEGSTRIQTAATIYSADEIRKKVPGKSSHKAKLKEISKYSTLENVRSNDAHYRKLHEQPQAVLKVKTDNNDDISADETFPPPCERRSKLLIQGQEGVEGKYASKTSNDVSSKHDETILSCSIDNPCNALENESFSVQSKSKARCSLFPDSTATGVPSSTTTSNVSSESDCTSINEQTTHRLQNSSESQPAKHRTIGDEKELEKGFLLTVGADQSSKTQSSTNSGMSSRFGSSLPLPQLDENSRPVSALKNEVSYSDLNLAVEDWLTGEFKSYASKFREQGYDTVGLLFGMTDKDLAKIGIEFRGHRQRLLREIKKIPRVDIEEGIPENVHEWLEELGLGQYWPKFESDGYKEPSDLEDLKTMSKESLKDTFNVHKPGHLNRLISAIRKLQYPDPGQMKIRHTRRDLDRLPLRYLDVNNQDDGNEYEFWEGLRQTCLIPELSAFGQTSKLKEKLVELRNTTLLIFGVTNALWMIIILTLVQHKDLKVLGVDIVGLGFLAVYGCIFVIQFLALLGHRFKTIVHILARTPWKLNNKIGNNRVCPSEPTGS